MTDPDVVLTDSISAIMDLTLDDVTEADIAAKGLRYEMVLNLLAELTILRDALEVSLLDTMPTDSLNAGAIRITREESTRSTWSDGGAARMREDVSHSVATKLATDVGTGEVDPVRRNLMQNAIRESLKYFSAPSGIKKLAREDLGLGIGDYKTFSHPNVITVTRITDTEES